jgi:hypothetical protein
MGRSWTKFAAIAVTAGTAVGTAALLVVQLPHPLNLLGTLAGPWLAAAFAVGTAARDRRSAGLAGAASMAAAVAAYYVARKLVHPGAPGGFTVSGQAVRYLVIGLLAGAGMAILGTAWKTGGWRWRGVAAGLLAGALGAEVLVLTARAWRGNEMMFALLQGGAAVAVAWFLPRSFRGRVVTLVVGVGSAVVVGGAILGLDLPLRLFP